MKRIVTTIALACSIAFAGRASADEINKSARDHFKAGVQLLQDPDGARFEEAYREFVAAYAATPSPKILGNLGFCAMKLERDAEAIDAYTRYLAEVGDIDPDERKQIERDIATMKTGLVRVTIKVDAPGASIVDNRVPVRGAHVINVYGPVRGTIELGIRAGHHAIRAKTDAGESTTWDFDAAPGATLAHDFVIVKPSKPAPVVVESGGSRLVPWLVTGVGAVTLAGGAVAGGLVMRKVNQIDSMCPNSECPAGSNLNAQRDSAKKTMVIADALFIGGGVALATGVIWLLVSGPSKPSTERAAPAAPQAAISCGPTGCVANLSGRF